MNGEINYTFRVIDNVSANSEKMAASQERLAKSTDKAKKSADSQAISFIAQMTAVRGVYSGLQQLNMSMTTLGLLSEKDAEAFRKFAASVGLVVGSFQLLRGAVEIVNMLRNAEIALAAVETYRSVLKNPAAIAMVGIGLGAAAGVGGYMLGRRQRGGETQVQQNITFQGDFSQQDRRSISRASLEVMGG